MAERLCPGLAAVLMICLTGCASSVHLAPPGYVPKRADLLSDVYGSYITLRTTNGQYSGELIGMRNDSVVVLGPAYFNEILRSEILDGRLIVHQPNSYAGGFVTMIPNVLLLTISGYGSDPAQLSLILTLVDILGMLPAKGAESGIKNYFDLVEGWTKVMQYARFPAGIPAEVNISTLSKRPFKME